MKARAGVWRWLVAGLALAAGLAATAGLADYTHRQALVEARVSFYMQLEDTAGMIEQSLRAYEKVLLGVAGLFAASDSIEPDEFAEYIQSLKLGSDFSGLRGIGYLRLSGQGPTRGCRLVQIEPPLGRNRLDLGRDFLADPAFAATMRRACEGNRPAISPKYDGGEADAPSQAGFAIFMPIYAKGRPHGSPEERTANLWGYVYAPFLADDLIAGLYGRAEDDIGLRLYDGVAPTEADLLFSSGPAAAGDDRSPIRTTEYIEVADRAWSLVAAARDGFQERFGADRSGLVAAFGAIVSCSLAAALWLLVSSRSRALRLATATDRKLRDTKEFFELVFGTIPDATVISRCADGAIVDVNYAFTRLTGIGREAAVGKTVAELGYWALPGELELLQEQLRRNGLVENMEARFRRSDGSEFSGMVSARLAGIMDEAHIVSVTRDITDRIQSEELINHLAHHDALTDLPNRSLFSDRMIQALALARRDQTKVGVVFLDLDRFKPVNDNYGHHVGDLLLKEAARRLQAALRESDTVGRIGGDEFVVLLPEVGGREEAVLVAEKLRQNLSYPYAIVPDQEITVSCSLGVAIFPDDGLEDSQLIHQADSAMYRDKARLDNPNQD